MAKIFYIAGPKRSGVGLTYNGQPITANSLPDLDEWGWDDYWGCEEWKAWHMELRKMLNAQDANAIWLQAWNQQSYGASPKSWCKYDTAFVNYFVSVGILNPADWSMIIPNVLNASGDVAEGVSDTISVASQIIKLLPIAALVFGSIWAYKELTNKK